LFNDTLFFLKLQAKTLLRKEIKVKTFANAREKDCPSIFNKEKTILPHEFHHQQLTKKFVID